MFKGRQLFISAALAFVLSGCAVVNFSANYYTPPEDYQGEVYSFWQTIHSKITFKKQYKLEIIDGEDSDRLNGVPAIAGQIVLLPDDFIKYVYQNYYDDRFTILSSVMVHEIAHSEYNIPSRPPEQHYLADKAAIKLLGNDQAAADNLYKSLFVVKNYWFARKGMGGHFLNASWNAASVASLFYGGPAVFADLYGSDLSKRMKFIRKNFELSSRKCFERSREKQTISE